MPSLQLNVYHLTKSSAALSSALSKKGSSYSAIDDIPGIKDSEFVSFPSDPSKPSWLESIQEAYAVPDQETKSSRGVLIVRADNGEIFGLAFGTGASRLIRPERIDRGWGKKIALNLLYDPSGNLLDTGERLRKRRSRQLGKGIVRDAQSSRPTSFEELGFDRAQDLLDAVTIRVDRLGWGKTVQGSDAFSLKWAGSVLGISTLISELEALAAMVHYKKHFDFIDHFLEVRVSSVLRSVWTQVTKQIRENSIESLGLTTSEPINLVDFDLALLGVRKKPKKNGHAVLELSVSTYVATLGGIGFLPSLLPEDLSKQRLRFTSEGEQPFEIRIRDLLEGTIQTGGKTYAISEGRLYEVASSYVADLDSFVDQVDASGGSILGLPPFSTAPRRKKKTKKGTKEVRDENAYSLHISKTIDRLCMDARNVVAIPGRTTAVEFADVVDGAKYLLHVKVGARSATLSHLLSQSAASAELLVESHDFRTALQKKIREACKDQSKSAPTFTRMVPAKLRNGTGYTVVLVIISDNWKAKTKTAPASAALPFLTKVNLRQAVKRMEQRAFEVTIACVPES